MKPLDQYKHAFGEAAALKRSLRSSREVDLALMVPLRRLQKAAPVFVIAFLSFSILGHSSFPVQLDIGASAVDRISSRFASIFERSGISGVGQDVLGCYKASVGNSLAIKECVVYDTAAMLVDRQLTKIETEHGMSASPCPIFSAKEFDARDIAHGFPILRDAVSAKRVVPQAALLVVDKVIERISANQ